jgi:hypothetical protein
MPQLSAAEKALVRRAMENETQDLREGRMNTLRAEEFLSEFPRMLFRKTDEKQEAVVSTDKYGVPREVTVLNDFCGYLCETAIADDADHAEQLASEGWDVSPQAAYGVTTGIVAKTTAKDDEIAELKRQLAERDAELAEVTAPKKAEKSST